MKDIEYMKESGLTRSIAACARYKECEDCITKGPFKGCKKMLLRECKKELNRIEEVWSDFHPNPREVKRWKQRMINYIKKIISYKEGT